VPNPQLTDVAGLRSQIASMSFVAALPGVERDALLDEVEVRLREHGLTPDQEIELPSQTIVRWARKRAR
jgi:hypothetical protein